MKKQEILDKLENDNNKEEILPHFHTLFEDYYLRLMVKAIVKTGQYVSIGAVSHQSETRIEPDSLTLKYDALKELDDLLSKGELQYFWHTQLHYTNVVYMSVYFVTPDLYKEFEEFVVSNVKELDSYLQIDPEVQIMPDSYLWVDPEVQIESEFVQIHKNDPRLIEFRSRAY